MYSNLQKIVMIVKTLRTLIFPLKLMIIDQPTTICQQGTDAVV